MDINTVNQTTISTSVLQTTPTTSKTMRLKMIRFNETIHIREIEHSSKLPLTNKQKTTAMTNTEPSKHWSDGFQPGLFVPPPGKYILNKEFVKQQKIEQEK